MIRSLCESLARKSLHISRTSFSPVGKYASTIKVKKDTEHNVNKVKNTKRDQERFKPRSLTTPMTFSQWKIHGPRLYEKRLHFLMKAGNGAKALETLQVMKEQQVDISPVAYNMVISVLAKQGDVKGAFKVFNKMKKQGLLPTERTYSSLFHGCAVVGHESMEIFDKIVAEMEHRSVTPNTITSNAMIQALAFCGEPDRALEVYELMTTNRTPVDSHTFCALLMASKAQTSDNGLKMAVDVWNELRRLDIKPDIYCYNLVLECLNHCNCSESFKQEDGKLPDGWGRYSGYAMLQFAKDFKLKLYFISNSKCDVRKLSLADAEAITNAMDKDSVKPNPKTLYFLMPLLPSGTAGKAILKILEKYQLSGDVMFFNSLVRNVAATEGFSSAMELLQAMVDRNLTVDNYIYQAVANCCCDKPSTAKLLSIIQSNGHSPNTFVWGTLCGIAAKQQDYSFLLYLIKEMKDMKCPPNRVVISILDLASSKKGDCDDPVHMEFCRYYSEWKKFMRLFHHNDSWA